jgi:hypothetical protein
LSFRFPFGGKLTRRGFMARAPSVRLLGLAVRAGICLSAASCFAGDEPLQRRFLAESPACAARLKAAIDQIEGVASISIDSKVDGKSQASRVSRWSFKVDGDRIVYEEILLDPEGKEVSARAQGSNPAYSFVVTRDSEQSPWLLKGVGPIQATQPTHPFVLAGRGGFLMYLRLAWCIAEIPLADLVKTQGFTIKRVSAVNENGRQLAVLDFDYTPTAGPPAESVAPQDRSSLMVIRRGQIYCDPDRFWAIQRYEIRGIGGITVKGSITHRDGPDGVPVVRSVVHALDNSQNGSQTVRIDFEPVAFHPVPEREFTLSAFGLPEPLSRSPGAELPSWAFFIGAGGLFLAAAAYLHRRTHFAQRAISHS